MDPFALPRLAAACLCIAAGAWSGIVLGAEAAQVDRLIRADYPYLDALYKHLHQHPELSLREVVTGARIASELQQAGFTVTGEVGGHGVVGVLTNGQGPTVLLRTDLDALPVKEETGAPYASRAKAVNAQGMEVDVMHACGHDLHMTVLVGTARLLAQLKTEWQGTLVLIGQPAEEIGQGARRMLQDGLFSRFPRPDHCLALHVSPRLPAGTIGFVEGPALANVDSVDLTVRGVGGHGAWPHTAKDPVVLAAQMVLAFQTIVSRETPPQEAAVITVGSIHGGTKHNIIPDAVELQLTLRSFSDEVRQNTLRSIERIARHFAAAAGLPEDRMPIVRVRDDFTPALHNDPVLTRRVVEALKPWLGEQNIRAEQPVMGGEDFSEYGRTPERVPVSLFWLGAVDPQQVRESERQGKPLPSLHSGLFLPAAEPAIQTGVITLAAAVLHLARPSRNGR